MTWAIEQETVTILTLSCNHDGCKNEINESKQGAHSYNTLAAGLKEAAIDAGWHFVDYAGVECYCPEHAKDVQVTASASA